MPRFTSILLSWILLGLSLPTLAWQVSLQQEATDKPIQVIVSNDFPLKESVDVYLVWFDEDAGPKFVSWMATKAWPSKPKQKPEGKWEEGIKPVFATALLEVSKFSSILVTSLENSCPAKHRCFLALIATLAGHDPSLVEDWQASSILPLSVEAGQERLPGQQFFLPNESQVTRDTTAYGTGVTADGSTNTEKTTTPVAAKTETPTADTEKPDIFKVVGQQVLYANSAAERFQVVNVADPTQPQLAGWYSLTGSPLELYVLGQYYVLLQIDYTNNETQTCLTVLTLGGDGKLTKVHEVCLTGQFRESRRRGEFIYVVMENYVTVPMPTSDCFNCGVSGGMEVSVKGFQLTTNGQLVEVDTNKFPGYSPIIAIFPDHLVVVTNDPQKWTNTQVTIFDLTQADGKLKALPTITVPGRVPSEFHVNVKDSQFRIVYGPENLATDGSTLAIYELPTMKLLGQVNKIAPGEDLFATRFDGDRAFVVTYERKDPLWVIDLADPSAPKIIGELEVPGWSEKLFFHENRLFAVGTDDQPLETEKDQWVRRVALSLFDVTDPTKPTLLSKLTPLAGKVNYSYSLALSDEQALLLDWEDGFAALPIEAYETETGSHLQIVSLLNNQITDVGLLGSPVYLQRSASLAPDLLAALGDQALLTVQWGVGKKPKILGELELASNLTWLTSKGSDLLAAGWGSKGLYRLYQYSTSDLEVPVQNWRLPKGFNGGVLRAGDLVVFYDYLPLVIQALDSNTGKLHPVQTLEKEQAPSPAIAEKVLASTSADVAAIAPLSAYNRTSPLVHDDGICIAEQQPILLPPGETQVGDQTEEVVKIMGGTTILPIPIDRYQDAPWILRCWKLFDESGQEAPTRSIPGRPLAFTAKGELITQEATATDRLRLNLVALDTNSAKLITSREFDCRSYSPIYWVGEMIYVRCDTEDRYWGPIAYATTKEGAQPTTEEPAQTTPTPSTLLLKLDPAQGLAEVGSWKFSGYRYVQAIAPDLVLLAPEYGWWGRPMLGEEGPVLSKSKIAAMPPITTEQTGCDVYQLPQGEPVLTKHLDTCPAGYQDSIVLTPTCLWVAEGFKGITQTCW